MEKKTVGSHKGNQYLHIEKELLEKSQDKELECGQNDHTENYQKSRSQNDTKDNLRTREKIATEVGVSPRTVQRAYEYSQAIDTIAENHGEEVKQKILTGAIKTTQKEVKELASKSVENPEGVLTARTVESSLFDFLKFVSGE